MKTSTKKMAYKPFKATPKLVEGQLNHVCNQLQLVQAKITDVERRHQRASKRQRSDICRTTMLQLTVLRGTYSILYEMGRQKASQLASLEVSDLMEMENASFRS